MSPQLNYKLLRKFESYNYEYYYGDNNTWKGGKSYMVIFIGVFVKSIKGYIVLIKGDYFAHILWITK